MKSTGLACALVCLAAGCGGSQRAAAEPPPPPPPRAVEAPPENSGISIEGQLGYLSQEALTAVLQPATQSLFECYTQRLGEHSFLAGHIELKIRIGADGSPRWVIPLHSTVGDRGTEQCMITRTLALRFPRPRGGETETTFPLDLEGGEDARPATEWPPGRIDRPLAQHRPALTACTHGMTGPFEVTLYAAPRGTIATAGVAVPNDGAAAAIECIVHEVTSWHVPSPGSWYAKTSFRLE